MKESQTIQSALRFAKHHRIEYIRMAFRPGVAVGWPDFLFLIPGGNPLFIEFKASGKRPTAMQARRIAQLRNLGYEVTVCDNPEDARAAILGAMETARLSA